MLTKIREFAALGSNLGVLIFRFIQLIGLGLCLTKRVMPGWEGVYILKLQPVFTGLLSPQGA